MASGAGGIRDHDGVYGPVTLTLHWTMAVLFGVQYGVMSASLLFPEAPASRALAASHPYVGAALLVLVLVRVGWLVLNLRGRRRLEPPVYGVVAQLLHATLYALMVVVPVAGAVQLVPALRPVGAAVHPVASWALLILALTHIAVASPRMLAARRREAAG